MMTSQESFYLLLKQPQNRWNVAAESGIRAVSIGQSCCVQILLALQSLKHNNQTSLVFDRAAEAEGGRNSDETVECDNTTILGFLSCQVHVRIFGTNKSYSVFKHHCSIIYSSPKSRSYSSSDQYCGRRVLNFSSILCNPTGTANLLRSSGSFLR